MCASTRGCWFAVFGVPLLRMITVLIPNFGYGGPSERSHAMASKNMTYSEYLKLREKDPHAAMKAMQEGRVRQSGDSPPPPLPGSPGKGVRDE